MVFKIHLYEKTTLVGCCYQCVYRIAGPGPQRHSFQKHFRSHYASYRTGPFTKVAENKLKP